MNFKCPVCSITLQAEDDHVGKTVRCPSCNSKLQIPGPTADSLPPPSDAWGGEKGHDVAGGQSYSANAPLSSYTAPKPKRTGWVETDPTNPNMLVSFGIGFVIFLAIAGLLYPFEPDPAKPSATWNTLEYLSNVFYKHLLVNASNLLFFTWSISSLFLKWQKLRHQREALLLDVLPAELGNDINEHTVGNFIDHVYSLPVKLRDSMMVNRIRKALELFEKRPSIDSVSDMMRSQSEIDGARIMTSYLFIKAFLWAIPIMGFIGTVLGLSHAIGGMNFAQMENMDTVKNTIGAVVSGLGTAFDATLVGLVLAVLLNFPMNTLMKMEDDNLSAIDAFCNEVLLPRLNDGTDSSLISSLGGETGAFVQALAQAMAGAQQEFLTDLHALTAKIQEQAMGLDRRADAHQQHVANEFSRTMIQLRESVSEALTESVTKTTDYVRTLASALQGLNGVLKDLGEKQVLIQQVKKKGWFGRE